MLENIYNYLKLSETLSTSGQPNEVQIIEIAQAGFQVVINLALADADYSLPDEAASVRAQGMEFIHIPVIWDHPTRSDLEAFFAAMEASKERKIFVHCAANMRVSVFIALYRMLKLGWSREEAMADVERIWKPNPTWEAFMGEALGTEGKPFAGESDP